MSMNRVINQADLVVEDMLKGWLGAHADQVKALESNPRVVHRVQSPQRGKVGVVTGGGSGHEPAFLGYVGDGMVDAVAVGEIFSSPTARSFLDAIRAADGGAGVACLYGNYAGDNMNVGMARQMAERDGITVRTVVANDDVASAKRGDEARRRGVAGEIFMWKVGAAKADMGGSLDEVVAAAQKAISNTRSVGIGLSACIIPAVGKANFHIENGTMEVGIGHHGEPGVDVRPTATAADMARLMLDTVLPDLPFAAGDRVAVLVSGLGATPVMEQYILYGELAAGLQAVGLTVAFNRVGNLFTSLEMMGVTLTLMKLDDELEACLNHPCRCVGLTVGGTADARGATGAGGAGGARGAAEAGGEAGARGAAGTGAMAGAGAMTGADGTANAGAAAGAGHGGSGAPGPAGATVTGAGGAAPASSASATPHAAVSPATQAPRAVHGPAVALGDAGDVVRDLIGAIVANRQYLSEIDGLIGDGDHGINMAKGFNGCGARLDALGDRARSLPVALEQLSQALMDDIGGSMGPLYGNFFSGLADTLQPHERLDAALFGDALQRAVANVQAMGNAQVGDKTLIDTLMPARDAYRRALDDGAGFADALVAMSRAAEAGRDSTKDLQARIGRSARLGARSIGVLDAGATSCCLILTTMAQSLTRHLPH